MRTIPKPRPILCDCCRGSGWRQKLGVIEGNTIVIARKGSHGKYHSVRLEIGHDVGTSVSDDQGIPPQNADEPQTGNLPPIYLP